MRWVTTSWTPVLAARDSPSAESRQALEAFCRAHWYPLYAFVRRQGYDPEDSRDLTQAYFAEFLEKEYLQDYDPSLGRFQVFLKTSFKHFLYKEREKARAWKRGGGTRIVSLSAQDVEGRYRQEPVAPLTPEEIFERRRALKILKRVLVKLRAEFSVGGREEVFDRLEPYLTGEKPKMPYRQLAVELRGSEEAMKSSVHRLRKRFGRLLRLEIAEMVASPNEVDDELRYLLKVISPWESPAASRFSLS